MVIHLLKSHPPLSEYQQKIASDVWSRAGLVPDVIRACTGFMVTNRSSLTSKVKNVTCCHCLRLIKNAK